MELALAVDIGGTKLAVGLVDANGSLLVSEATPTGDHESGDVLFGELADLVDAVLAQQPADTDVVVCGVGSGGPMGRGGVWVSPLNIAAWREFPLQERLAAHTGVATFVDNDAKALALGELWKGAAQGESDFIAMVVSTGVGGGIVLDGRLLDGRDGNAGHIGHLIVDPNGQPCVCGATGCLEAEASGTGIANITGAPAADASPEMRERTGRMVGLAVASVANLLDLPLALIAGSVALGYGDSFFTAAQAEVDARAQISHARGTRVLPAGLGSDGPLIGAAAVGWRGLGRPLGES